MPRYIRQKRFEHYYKPDGDSTTLPTLCDMMRKRYAACQRASPNASGGAQASPNASGATAADGGDACQLLRQLVRRHCRRTSHVTSHVRPPSRT